MFWILLFLIPFKTFASEPIITLESSIHRALECEECHSAEIKEGKTMPGVDCSACHKRIYEKYTKSVHGKLKAEGIEEVATCYSCHGTHDILPMGDPASRIYKLKVPQVCGQCHEAIFEEYRRSVHGTALISGVLDTPVCTDCHGEHSILPHTNVLSRVFPANIAKTTCPQCHDSERIVTKYNIPGGRVDTYKDTYHGLAGEIGDVRVANCASCHGVHLILPSSDPRSQVHPDNVTETCGKCHPNANENFAKGSVHGYLKPGLSKVVIHNVTWFYIFLIVVVIGGLLFHNCLDYLKKIRIVYQNRKQEPSYFRMSLNERIQHGLLLVSFSILVITGFALKFGWSLPYLGGEVNTFLRGTLHRIFGLLMLGVFFYNTIYFLVTKRGRKNIKDFWPRLMDLKHVGQYVMYLIGWRSEKPRFGRFTYWQKMEYWSVVWGIPVMGITGLILWFENFSLSYIPKWGIDVATLVHYLEAILATLAVIVGHLYYVVADPNVAPMSFTWLVGKIPAEYAQKEHPLEYEDKPVDVKE